MRFDEIKQQRIHCKELGPNIAASVEPSATYEDLIEEGKKHLFPCENNLSALQVNNEYFLADAKGSKLPDKIKGRS